MNSTEAIISPNSEELLEFLMLEPHSQQVPSSQTVTEGIFVVYLEGIFMLNSIFNTLQPLQKLSLASLWS